MGMDPAALIDQAYAQARRAEVMKQMDGVGNLSEEMRRMLPNIAEIDSETGAAGATIGGEFKTLSEIAADPRLQEQLVEETRSESEDIKVIAKSVMGIEQIVAGITGQVDNELARNAVMPGVVGGKSSLELAMETLTRRINEETIAGAAKLDQSVQSLLQNWNVLTGSVINEAIKPFSSSSPEEFSSKLGEAFENVFGKGAHDFGEKLGEKLTGVAETIGKKLEEYGFTPMEVFHSREHEGVEGRTTPIVKPETQEPTRTTSSVAMAARDVTIQATSFSLNGGENAQIKPIEGSQVSRAAAAVQGDGTQLLNLIQALATSAGYTVITAPLNPSANNGQTGTQIYASPESIPGTTVAPGGNGPQTADQRGGAEGRNGNNGQTISLSVSGTITVVGDKGEIGTADILKLLDTDEFRREVAKMLGDKYVDVNKRF